VEKTADVLLFSLVSPIKKTEYQVSEDSLPVSKSVVKDI